jgi:epoxyqueuosine reductase QueG
MSEHPVVSAIRRASFEPLGWFETSPGEMPVNDARFVILIGNAGPTMFNRFSRERRTSETLLDDWTRSTVDPLAETLSAHALYPFDRPPVPFLSWARRGGAGHVSPLGLNIHPTYGLWHAYRAALLFPVAFDLPPVSPGPHPCESCETKPCLTSCPVSAFDGNTYDVNQCAMHLATDTGNECMTGGCKARLACPVGMQFKYSPHQMQFHMNAFLKARQEARK